MLTFANGVLTVKRVSRVPMAFRKSLVLFPVANTFSSGAQLTAMLPSSAVDCSVRLSCHRLQTGFLADQTAYGHLVQTCVEHRDDPET